MCLSLLLFTLMPARLSAGAIALITSSLSFPILYCVVLHCIVIDYPIAVRIKEFTCHQDGESQLFIFFVADIVEVFCEDAVIATFRQTALGNIKEPQLVHFTYFPIAFGDIGFY